MSGLSNRDKPQEKDEPLRIHGSASQPTDIRLRGTVPTGFVGVGVPPEAERSEGRCSSALAGRPPAGSGRDCYTANTGRKREETALADGTDSATATSGFFRVGCMRGLWVISPVVY